MASSVHVTLEDGGIALVTLDVPGRSANVLSSAVLDELESVLDQWLAKNDLAGLILRSGKPGSFIVGADVKEFAAAAGKLSRDQVIALAHRGRRLFQRLSQCPMVTVVAIDGVCVGGGAELAIWCDRRVMADHPRTQFGFPEVKLGMFPGWGGTVRTPKIIGLSNAVELICSGDSVGTDQAYKMGLADDVVPPDRLLEAARQLVQAEAQLQNFLRDRQRWLQPEPLSDEELNFLAATASAYLQQQTKGQYPAPLAALEVMLSNARETDLEAACRREAEGFAELFGTPVNRALINLFLLSDRNKKDPGIAAEAAQRVQPRTVQRVGVVGAGIMGSGIAAACLRRGLSTVITDARPDALERAIPQILQEAAYDRQAGAASLDKTLELSGRLDAAVRDEPFADCDLVIEAVVENPKVKREVFGRLENVLRDDALLATNTSTIPIARLAEGLRHPQRFLGIHFFNPVRKMQLVEVIRGPQTSDEAVAAAVALAKGLKKSPVVVQDGPGFLVNRLLFPYMNEALLLLEQGAPIEAVDKAARQFGMPMGPITLFDVVGLDTALYAGGVLAEAYPDRIVQSPLLSRLVEAGRLGQKSGAGFFAYPPDKKGKSPKGVADPAVEKDFLAPLVTQRKQFTMQQLQDRLFLPMLLEASRAVQEQVVRDPRDVDLALVLGIGFPPFKGGLLYWADSLGAAAIVEKLKPYQALGPRFAPTELLLELARTGNTFYPA